MWNNDESPIQLKVILPNNVLLTTFLHGNGPWTIGSAPDCDLPVKAKGVSRRHLELVRSGDGLSFRDLESTNGSILNGEKASEGTLNKESVLEIGEALIRVGGTDTDNVENQSADGELRLQSFMDIGSEGSSIPSSEPSKQLINLEFMTRHVDRFFSEGDPRAIAGEFASFMKELLQCQSVRFYETAHGGRILFAESGTFPDRKIQPGQLDILLAQERVSGFVLNDKSEPLYFLVFPLKFNPERKVTIISVMPYFQNALIQNQDTIPTLYLQTRLVAKWGWEILKKKRALDELRDRMELIEKGEPRPLPEIEPIIGRSRKLLKEIETADRFAPTETPVMIFGATGTGKELFARRIHHLSGRAKGPFVALNCASIPETLLESELFGAERGAYTGADKSRKGYFEKANGGTLFLDEIGDLPLSLQPKLLRVLQEKQFSPLGSTRVHPTDVRLIAATNQDLFSAVGTGRFRQDLFYRLTEGIPIHLPPLSERGEDILLLANYFLHLANREFKKSVNGFDEQAVDLLKKYSWPGNVRQMQSLVKHMVLLCNGQVISAELAEDSITRHKVPQDSFIGVPFWTLPISEAKDAFEKEYLTRRLAVHDGSISALAKELGIARPNLYIKLKRWGLGKK